MNEQVKREVEGSYGLIEEANKRMFHIWMNHVIFSWQWWLVVFLTLVPWALWIWLRKKGSEGRLLSAGLLVIVIVSWFDFLGVAMGAWHYHMEALPFIPAFLPWDFSLFPVIVMFLIQIKPGLNPFVKAVLFALFAAFVAETIAEVLNLYDPEKWNSIYSFPIYVMIYLGAHFISTRKFEHL